MSRKTLQAPQANQPLDTQRLQGLVENLNLANIHRLPPAIGWDFGGALELGKGQGVAQIPPALKGLYDLLTPPPEDSMMGLGKLCGFQLERGLVAWVELEPETDTLDAAVWFVGSSPESVAGGQYATKTWWSWKAYIGNGEWLDLTTTTESTITNGAVGEEKVVTWTIDVSELQQRNMGRVFLGLFTRSEYIDLGTSHGQHYVLINSQREVHISTQVGVGGSNTPYDRFGDGVIDVGIYVYTAFTPPMAIEFYNYDPVTDTKSPMRVAFAAEDVPFIPEAQICQIVDEGSYNRCIIDPPLPEWVATTFPPENSLPDLVQISVGVRVTIVSVKAFQSNTQGKFAPRSNWPLWEEDSVKMALTTGLYAKAPNIGILYSAEDELFSNRTTLLSLPNQFADYNRLLGNTETSNRLTQYRPFQLCRLDTAGVEIGLYQAPAWKSISETYEVSGDTYGRDRVEVAFAWACRYQGQTPLKIDIHILQVDDDGAELSRETFEGALTMNGDESPTDMILNPFWRVNGPRGQTGRSGSPSTWWRGDTNLLAGTVTKDSLRMAGFQAFKEIIILEPETRMVRVVAEIPIIFDEQIKRAFPFLLLGGQGIRRWRGGAWGSNGTIDETGELP